jgi:bla regulator protein BlaR1
MNEIAQSIADSPLSNRIGLVLLYSLWEFSLLALIGGLVLGTLRHRSAELRYVVSGMIIALMAGAAALTFGLVSTPEYPSETPGINSLANATPQGVHKVTVPPAVAISDPAEESSFVDEPALGLETVLAKDRESEPVFAATLARSGRASLSQVLLSILNRAAPWISALWLLGVVVLAVRNTGGWLAAQRMKHLSLPVDQGSAFVLFERLIERMNLKRVRLYSSDLLALPVVIGALKPAVLVPIQMVTGLTAAELRAILAHELAHVKRHDYR